MLVTLAWLSAPFHASQQTTDNVRDFALRLAVNGVPAGVVVRESEFVEKTSEPHQANPKGRAVFSATLPQLLSDFNSRNRNVRARSANGVVRVEATRLPDATKDLLAREVFIEGPQRVAAGDAIFKTLMSLVRGSAVTAIAGTGVMPGPSCRLQDAVEIPLGTYTVSSYLDRVVAHLPGLVWLVTFEQPNDGLKIGVLCPGGESLKMRIAQ
jgi:hypothetical protein